MNEHDMDPEEAVDPLEEAKESDDTSEEYIDVPYEETKPTVDETDDQKLLDTANSMIDSDEPEEEPVSSAKDREFDLDTFFHTDKVVDDDNPNDLSDFFTILLSDDEALEQYVASVTEKAFLKAKADPKSIEAAVVSAMEHLMATVDRQRNQDFIDKVQDFAHRYTTDKMPNEGRSARKPRRTDKGPAVIKDKSEAIRVLGNFNSVRKIILPNSGFFIILKSPSLATVHDFYKEVALHINQLGYYTGTPVYYTFSNNIHELFLDLVQDSIIGSNLKNFRRNFKQCLSMLDINDLYWAMSSLIYKDGYETTLVCATPSCQYRTKMMVDVDKMRIIDRIRINPERLNAIYTEQVNLHDVENYRKDLQSDLKSTTLTLNDRIKVSLKVPDAKTYIESFTAINNMINEKLSSRDKRLTPEMINQATPYFLNMLGPWVDKVYFYMEPDDEEPDSYGNFENTKDILFTIPITNQNVIEELDTFIRESSTSMIGYTNLKCPQCGEATRTKDGVQIVDPQTVFFYQCWAKSIETQRPYQT